MSQVHHRQEIYSDKIKGTLPALLNPISHSLTRQVLSNELDLIKGFPVCLLNLV